MVTFVEGDRKDPFSIATTPRCKGGRNSIPWIVLLDPYLIMLSVKQSTASSTIFKSLVRFDLGLNPGLPDH